MGKTKRKFIVDRAKWRCGEDGKESLGTGRTALHNESGYMCCLGMVCEQSGLKVPKDNCLPNPSYYGNQGIFPKHQLEAKIPFLINIQEEHGNFNYSSSEFSISAMNINDNPRLSQLARESSLKKLFLKENIELEFIN